MEKSDPFRIPSTKYLLVEEFDLEKDLESYKDHPRMQVFFHKGTACSMEGCKRKGTRLILGKDNGGSFHIDVYTSDLVLMTRDHYIPKSHGGSDELENLVPMCSKCNSRKGDRFVGTNPDFDVNEGTRKEQRAKVRYGRKWRKFIRKHAEFKKVLDGDHIIKYTKITFDKLNKVI